MSRKKLDLEKAVQSDLRKIDSILRHIDAVRDNCVFLGKKLIERGQRELGRMLIANSMLHDNSKFYGLEFEKLHEPRPADGTEPVKPKKDPMLAKAVAHHGETNKHHPNAWGGITNMPVVCICEMLCDWKARSSEFGEDLREWVEKKATKKYGFKMSDPVGQKIAELIDLLLEKPF